MANRSAFEEHLERRLIFELPGCSITTNRRDLIKSSNGRGLELDLYLEVAGLKIAIDILGITHFQEVYDSGRLERTQELDLERIAECKAAGIHIVTVNISGIKNFTVEAATPYINEIVGQIKAILKANGITKLRPTLSDLKAQFKR